MHRWGDKGVDWQAISEAASYIGKGLRKWGRVTVFDYKEKWGTVRVYCSFGLLGLPGHLLNWILIPYQEWLYLHLYKKAVAKWPHIRLEILSEADWPELLAPLGVHVIRTGKHFAAVYVDWAPGQASHEEGEKE